MTLLYCAEVAQCNRFQKIKNSKWLNFWKSGFNQHSLPYGFWFLHLHVYFPSGRIAILENRRYGCITCPGDAGIYHPVFNRNSSFLRWGEKVFLLECFWTKEIPKGNPVEEIGTLNINFRKNLQGEHSQNWKMLYWSKWNQKVYCSEDGEEYGQKYFRGFSEVQRQLGLFQVNLYRKWK